MMLFWSASFSADCLGLLDDQYLLHRAARTVEFFLELLNEYCGNSQFIVTTFHPELLGPAEVSHIAKISEADAIDFVEDESIRA
ncbi:hypothetical protein WR25_18828 [Diploscapter pachys]|uniref:Uncharacterized protein n=1 Tax=Diploscapter pachys TaxID=2018661 RepID=A0A2A2K601_9BILA|nr:hypothetical protein WR25_18828 [Diploscapter pachys]